LPANAPTDLIDKSKFGTGDDDSNLGAKNIICLILIYLGQLISLCNLLIPPKNKISQKLLIFNKWTTSKGSNNADWYMDKPIPGQPKLFKK
jgi:hypothetical protein